MNEKQKPRIHIGLLGPPEITIDGSALLIKHQTARALLFYLAANGHPFSREYLATLFWSESNPANAYHSLRSCIYHLRQALRPYHSDTVLVSDGESLWIEPGAYECDVLDFRRGLEQGDEPGLAQAVGLYRGSLLQGFSLPDSAGFEEWVQAEVSNLSQTCLDALRRLAAWAEAREDWTSAMNYVQHMLQIDALDEAAQQQMLRLYLRQGQVSWAVRQYRQFASRLQQELNLSPSEETRSLLQDALRIQQTVPIPAAKASSEAPFSTPAPFLPFVGRDALLEQLVKIGAEGTAGRGATVLIQGEGGMGKTRLLEECSARLAAGSPAWLVLKGACSPFDDLLSHGPFIEALSGGVPGFIQEMNPVPLESGAQFSWTILQSVRSLAQVAPLLLIIDDLQWANSSTLNLFAFLSMRIRPLPVLLVGTVQSVDIPALRRLVSIERHRGELHLFQLNPLTLENVQELLQAFGLDPTSREIFSEWLHAKSEGNPFLLNEILSQLRAESILQAEGSTWRLETTQWLRWRATFQLPETAHDLVSWRLANLSPAALSLLDILAVAGHPLPAAALQACFDRPAVEFPLVVDDLASRGLIVEPPGGMLALPHHLLREALLYPLSQLRRRSIYCRLAEALEQQVDSGAGLIPRQIAMYAVAGEDVERARSCGLSMLPDLPQEYSGAETVEFVHHLYDLLAPSASTAEMVQLTRALGTLEQARGHLELAAGWHAQNLQWAQKAGDSIAQAEAHLEMGELALMRNDYHAAAQAAEESLSILDREAGPEALSAALHRWMGKGHRLLGAALAMEGSRLASAEQHLQAAVDAYRQAGNSSDLCAALFEIGNIAAQRGEVQRALDLYAESRQVAEAARAHYYQALACNNFAYHSLLLGQAGAAQQSAAQGIKIAESYDLLAVLLHLYSTQGEIELYQAKWKEAQESFRRGLALADDLGSLERQAGYRGGLALAAQGLGRPDEALMLLNEALTLIAGQGYWHLYTRLQLWRAELLLQQGFLTQAGEALEAALAIARSQNRTLLLAEGESLRARLAAASGPWPEARALFSVALEKASELGLPLETAQVQAAWGEAALRHAPTSGEGPALLAAARAVFLAHNALADLAAFKV
jgi:DNA-binding SARP family transcriptional activator